MSSSEIRITPSILNADRAHLSEEIARIAQVSDLIHLDIMDNKFVPNFTFDFESAEAIIKSSPVAIDSHLMVEDVDRIAIQYAEVGSASVTVHLEAVHNLKGTLRGIRREGARAAVALKPATSIDSFKDFADEIDMILIMTVEPGFGGQRFIEEMIPKINKARRMIGDLPIWLQVDGGISLETIERAVVAGADTLVAGSAVFNAPDPVEMVKSLRNAALRAQLHSR